MIYKMKVKVNAILKIGDFKSGDTAKYWQELDNGAHYWCTYDILYLFDNNMAILDGVDHPVPVGDLRTITQILANPYEKFPLGSKVEIRTGFFAGVRGTVSTVKETLDYIKKHPLKYDEDLSEEDFKRHVCVHLDRDPFYDGWSPLILTLLAGQNPEPRNNDGRSNCFWCGAPTREFGMGFGHVCTSCGK